MFRLLIIAVLSMVFTGVLGSSRWCRGGCYTNGICYRHGDTWEDNCSTKRCRQYNSNYASTETIGTKCKDAYGQCKNHGDEMTVNVNGYAEKCRCSVNHNRWSYTQCGATTTKTDSCDCNTSNGCRTFGQRWKEDCFTMECMRTSTGWKTDPVSAECKDAYGNCKRNGQLMTKVLGGQMYNNCRCSVNGLRAGYSC